MHPGDIGLCGAAFLELLAQVFLRMRGQGEDHDAGRIPVQPVHQQRLGKGVLHPGQQAIRQMRALARHRQKPGGLVDDKHLVIVMQDRQRAIGRGVIGTHARLGGASAPGPQGLAQARTRAAPGS